MRFFVVILAFLGWSSLASGQTTFGRYTGVFQNDTLQQEQLAKLDFIVSRQSASELKLMAVLTLHFGGYGSQEYVSYHFDDVKYNILSGTLVFDKPDQDTTFVVRNFAGGRLEADLRSVVAGNVGRLILTQSEEVTTSRPLVQPLWGEYRGMCNGFSTRLQIQTSRSAEDTSRMGNPFGTYDVTAQLAEDDPSGCLGTGSACVKHVYDTGSYNFYTGNLTLYGRSRDLECRVEPDGLSCNGCVLKRTSKEAESGSSHALVTTQAFWQAPPLPARDEPATTETADGIQGQYWGYLFHERLGIYQPAAVNVVTFQDPSGTGTSLKMSAVATLYFGQHGSEEAIPYRFDERTYDVLAPQMVFERIEADTDAVLQVTKIAGGEITGIWYSILYGRIGTFVAKKGAVPDLPQGATTMAKVSGHFESSQWQLALRTARESAPINTRNPFFPMNLKGQIRMPDITANIQIKGGTYDFYTGKFTIILSDDTRFAGERPSGDRLLLKRPTPGVARPLVPHTPQTFRLVGP